jgi:molybdate transport system substrate-binding protein
MRGTIRILGAGLVGLFLAQSAAQAAEVKVIAAGALQVALRNLAADYQAKTGTKVTIVPMNPAKIPDAMGEGGYDVVAAAVPSIAEFGEQGKLAPRTTERLARTGIGIAIKAGAPKPDLSTISAFKAAVKNAKNIIYTNPSVPNTSGAVTQHILVNAGLLDMVKAKGKEEGLAEGREMIAKGEYEMGFFNVSEAKGPGVVLAGPVPAALQQYTNYDVALVKGAPDAKDGAAFVKFLTSKAVAARWTAAGLEQMARR